MQDQLLDDQDIKFPSDWYPSAWRRFLAALIDSLVLMVIVGFLNGLLFSFTGETKIFAPLFLIIPIYKWWIEAKRGATIGKKAQKIVVVAINNHQPISYMQSFKRNVCLLLYFLLIVLLDYIKTSTGFGTVILNKEWVFLILRLSEFLSLYSMVYLVGFFFLLFNPSRKNLFDHLAGTVCINKKHPTASK